MSRLTFDDLTPDDMPEPFIDDSGDRADAFRDSLADLIPCGVQTMPTNHPVADWEAMRMLALRPADAKIEGTPENATELAHIVEAFDELYCAIGHTDGVDEDERTSLWCADPVDTFAGFDDKVARIGIDEDATRDLVEQVFALLPTEAQEQLRAIYPEADL